MKFFRDNFDFLILALIIGGFVFVAAQRLGTIPIPQTDEAYTLQVPYEMLNHGKIALPMHRFLGGNIENSWHSYTPVYFLALSGYFKLFGWGILQGRAFNLITAILVMIMLYLVARKLFDWRAGIFSIVMLISDTTFLERSRMLRNDYAAAFFAMLAFYLYELAERRRRGWLFIASGLAAGAGVMCHTNILYMLAAVCLLMLLRRGWRVLKSKELYQFALSALAVMAYEIISILADLNNFLLQNRDDKQHFKALSPSGLWRNLRGEISFRYEAWIGGHTLLGGLPQPLLHVFQVLTAISVVYLIAWCVKRKSFASDARGRVLFITLFLVFFMAFVAGNKEIYYMAHLAAWFALCVGIFLRDGLSFILKPRTKRLYKVALAGIAITAIVYSLALVEQNRKYLKAVHNPNLATFDEFSSVLRSVIPAGLCPVTIKAPVMWLVFPEYDRCFASIESRMWREVDIDGKEHALLLPKGELLRSQELRQVFDAKYPLIADFADTPYGDMCVYYTGNDPRYKNLPARQFFFFGKNRGHYDQQQLAAAPEIWSAAAADLSRTIAKPEAAFTSRGLELSPDHSAQRDGLIEMASIPVRRDRIYELNLETLAGAAHWAVVVFDEKTGDLLLSKELTEHDTPSVTCSVFKSLNTEQVRLAFYPGSQKADGPLYVSRVGIREVAGL